MWLVFLMYALFASVFTVGKISLEYSAPFFLTGVRMLLAGLLLIVYLAIKSPEKIVIKKKALPMLIGLAFFNVFITNALEFWALQYMETAKTCLIYSLSPFAAIFLSFLFLSEKMSWKKWLGLVIGILGFLPIFLNQTKEEGNISFGYFSLPEIAVSISAITSVIGWIIMKKLMNRFQYPFVTANAFSFLIAGIMSIMSSLCVETWNPVPVTSWSYFIPTLFYIAIIHNVIAYNLYAYSLNTFSISFMTFAGFINPLFTAIYGWIFLNEKVGLPFFFSLFLIFVGIFIYSRAEKYALKVSGKGTRS